jgi:hypothetical protein
MKRPGHTSQSLSSPKPNDLARRERAFRAVRSASRRWSSRQRWLVPELHVAAVRAWFGAQESRGHIPGHQVALTARYHGVGMAGDDRLRHRNLRNHESTRVQKMPRALRDAIAADAIFGALLLVRALL